MTHSDGSKLGKLIEPRRNNYFYGKLLDVGHLEMEQRYFNRKRWLANRLALGCGVLCGLQVTEADGKLLVAPGVAVDGFGREIVVPTPIELDPWRVVDVDGVERDWKPGTPRTVYVCLEYRECFADFQPALVSSCGTEPRGLPGTIVEGYALHLHANKPAAVDMDAAFCEAIKNKSEPAAKRAELCEALSDLECSPGDIDPCVILAAVELGDAADPSAVHVHGCEGRTVLYSNERLLELLLCLSGEQGGAAAPAPVTSKLSRIAKTSWGHDGEIGLQEFPAELTVTFSSSGVTSTTKNGTAWFVVSLELPSANQPGSVMAAGSVGGGGAAGTGMSTSAIVNGTVALAGRRAIFSVDQTFLDRATAVPTGAPAGVRMLCRVMVKCDFLLDANGVAVDGNHLGGQLPTGDGVPGGTFESWFFVTL